MGLGEPPKGWDAIDPKTGAPVGVGKGFGYTPGAGVKRSVQSPVDDKLLRLDAPIGVALFAEIWRDLPLMLDRAEVDPGTKDQALAYAMALGEPPGKVVVRVNFNEKGRFDGQRARIVSNFVRSGGLMQGCNVDDGNFIKPKR